MTITFVSNYINHHQLPFCDSLYEQLGDDFTFLQSIPIEEERINMGWDNEGEKRPYVRFLYNDEQLINLLIESDILLVGWSGVAKVETTVIKRLKQNKPTFRISERIYKTGRWKIISPRGLFYRYREFTRFRRHPYYLLCIGTYVAADFKLLHAFPNKKFRWGYFPKTYHYGEELWQKKATTEVVQICWAGRFIELKHPEYMIKLAHDLHNQGYTFHLNMIGSGEMESQLHQTSTELGLNEMITFHGTKSPENVREIMEKCHIFALTSNHIEGWGAVLSEAMNSGMAVVASTHAGATRFLIDNGVNGFYYRKGNYNELLDLIKQLLEKPDLQVKFGKNAYHTIATQWNAEHAAAELLRVCHTVQKGEEITPAKTGPLSIAPTINP